MIEYLDEDIRSGYETIGGYVKTCKDKGGDKNKNNKLISLIIWYLIYKIYKIQNKNFWW